MQNGEFEKATRWVGGTIADIVPCANGGADQVIGIFEVGFKVPEGHKMTRGQLLQKLRERVVELAIFGENPSMSSAGIQGRAPDFAEPADTGIVAINYRQITNNDIPIWPGVIAFADVDKEESRDPNGNL